jgi:excisionase family DNA binding protein
MMANPGVKSPVIPADPNRPVEQAQVQGFLTVSQAAKAANLSCSSIYEACERKLLAHYRMSGTGRRGKILIRPADLAAFIESRRVEAGETRSPTPPLEHISLRG